MPRLIHIALSLLLFVVASLGHAASDCPPAAAQPTPEMVQEAARNARDHGFLWRISKGGHTSFLYGTIHVGKLDWAVPGPDVMQAIRATDTIALELDMLDPAIQGKLVAAMTAQHGAPLPERLARRVRKQADAACIPYEGLARLSPEMQVTTLTMLVGRREGLDASYAMDAVLAGMGHSANKRMVSLETPEMQMQLLQMQDREETIAFVEDNLDELESGRSRDMLSRIAKAWAGADYAMMDRFEEWCECYKTEVERQSMKRLLDDRNPDLAAHIDELHNGGRQVFAAVGSLHMFGPLGLPTLMVKRGYRVERVEFRP